MHVHTLSLTWILIRMRSALLLPGEHLRVVSNSMQTQCLLPYIDHFCARRVAAEKDLCDLLNLLLKFFNGPVVGIHPAHLVETL